MEEGSKGTKNRRFIVELTLELYMNIRLLLYLEIESKNSVFGIRGSSGKDRGFSLSLLRRGGLSL